MICERFRQVYFHFRFHFFHRLTMTRATPMLNAIVCTILFSFLSSLNIITHLTSLNIEHQCHDKKCNFKITKSNMFFQPEIIITFFCSSSFSKCICIPPLFCAFLFLRIVLDAFGKRGSEASVHRKLSMNIFHIWNIILNKCKCADSTFSFKINILIFEVNLFHHCLFNRTFFFSFLLSTAEFHQTYRESEEGRWKQKG